MKSYGRQSISEADVAAVVATLKSDFLTQGPKVAEFEAALCKQTKASHAVAVNSATSALHVACLALGIQEGSLGWTVSNTFVASANALRMCGADVDFVDIDATTGNLCITALKAKLAAAKAQNILPDVVIPVHFAGQSCDMAAIRALSDTYGFAIIEDASHALGGHYQGEPVGSCRYSDISVVSFHPVKMITTAEGGAALTQNESLAKAMRAFASHGINREGPEGETPAPWQYYQHTLGYNYRMPDVLAALGTSQISRLDDWVARRNTLAKRYDTAFKESLITPLAVAEECISSYHIYVVRLPAAKRLACFEQLKSRGIGVQVHYIPVHSQPYYQARGKWQLPNTQAYYESCLTLPLYPELTEAEQDEIIAILQEVIASL